MLSGFDLSGGGAAAADVVAVKVVEDGGGRGAWQAGNDRSMASPLLHNDQHGFHGDDVFPHARHQLHRYAANMSCIGLLSLSQTNWT